jgi:hypothetical protein
MKTLNVVLLALIVLLSTVIAFQAQQKDVPGEIENARHALQNAQNDLNHAGTEWGGHRVNAIKHIDAAITELNEAEQYARSHHDIK